MESVPSITAMIVDDEAPARLRIRELLARSRSVVVAGEYACGADAVTAVRKSQPDLLFLDVQMPVMDGFRVLREIGPERMPVTIFATAYDRYALAAFEAHALDYLLKPYSDERFESALDRALTQIELQQTGPAASRVLAMLDRREGARLAIRVNGRVVILKSGDIDWIEAAGVYVELHVGRKVYLHRAALADMEIQLDPTRFVRVHRSALVNLDRIKELAPRTHGEFSVMLLDGTELKLSRGYRHRVEELLGGF
jgi:two-component system LytT family response regulator